jgi:hypothetical protein
MLNLMMLLVGGLRALKIDALPAVVLVKHGRPVKTLNALTALSREQLEGTTNSSLSRQILSAWRRAPPVDLEPNFWPAAEEQDDWTITWTYHVMRYCVYASSVPSLIQSPRQL